MGERLKMIIVAPVNQVMGSAVTVFLAPIRMNLYVSVKMELIPIIVSRVGVSCDLWYFYCRFGSYHDQELVII